MRRTALATAIFAGLTGAGCATTGPVAGTALSVTGFSYAAGRATQDFALPAPTVQSAITTAMEDLRMQSTSQTSEAGALIYHGTTADNRRVTIHVRPNPGATRVSVRIGWFGDEPLSKALMDRIGVRLGTLPPTAIPTDPPSSPGSNPYFSKSAIPDSVMLRDQADAIYRDTPVP